MNGNVTATTAPADSDTARDIPPAGSPCNICGSPSFRAGPNGRLGIKNMPPRCEKCGSLERHRAFRSLFDRMRSVKYRSLSCLMFSKDPTVAGGWFGSILYSLYQKENSLDVQAIDRPDASFDVVVCNHILEHVPRYEEALRELIRVTKPTGFAFVSFPSPHYKTVTTDWGYPKPEMHGHYRVFGSDIEQKLPGLVPGTRVARLIAKDPVTGVEDRAYLMTRNQELLAEIRAKGLDPQVL